MFQPDDRCAAIRAVGRNSAANSAQAHDSHVVGHASGSLINKLSGPKRTITARDMTVHQTERLFLVKQSSA